MIKQNIKNDKCMNLDYSDDYRAMMDYDNPYNYNFGRVNKEHTHTDSFQKLQNRINYDYFSKK